MTVKRVILELYPYPALLIGVECCIIGCRGFRDMETQGVYLLQWNHEGNTLSERLIVE